MTLLLAEGFDSGMSSTTCSSPVTLYTGRRGYGYSGSPSTSLNAFSATFPAQTSDIYITFWMYYGTAPAGNHDVYGILNAAGNELFNVRQVSANTFVYRRSTTVLGTGTITPATAAWHRIDIHYLPSDTVGVLQVWIDGVLDCNFSGGDSMQSTGAATTLYMRTYSDAGFRFDDLVICNGSGSVNNGLLGNTEVLTLAATGATASGMTSVSGAANWENIDRVIATETEPLTYNYTDTATVRDVYQMADLPSYFTDVKAVVTTAEISSAGSTTRQIKTGVKSSASESLGSASAPTAGTRIRKWSVFETDPNTSAAWSNAAVSAAEMIVEAS